ncbi:MAG: InlB B-repeat-containing protein [Lachnospiraceae bacterium]|nr:InlB B-repeat-containing protein [Lachnospiraceae bacterium]
MKRKGMGKRIATMVLAITMSISMAGFQTGIVKAETPAETTEEPSTEPTEGPSVEPTGEPSAKPTEGPSAEPTGETSTEPTEGPSEKPTEETPAETSEENYNAEFYILKNVNVIPLENGSTQYPASNYTTKDLENMVGVVTGVQYVDVGDKVDVTGLNIAEAFRPVQEMITGRPEVGYLETLKEEILTAQGYTDGFENYDILWYVVKTAGGTYHVDGVVYDMTANFKSLTYDANTTDVDSVTGITESMAYPLGTEVTIAADPSRSGYTFLGWTTEAEPDGLDDKLYKAGDKLLLEENTTLYAQWEKNATTKTDVNFYIQLDSAVMDIEGDINRRPVNYFSGSVAQSTMNVNVDTKFTYAGEVGKAADANSTIRGEYLGKEEYVQDCPDDAVVFANLQKDAKTLKKFAELDINVTTLTAKNYDIYWYVVKYDTADGWHVDGILQKKGNLGEDNSDGDNQGGGNTSGGTTPGGSTTPGGGTNPGGSTTPGGDSGTVVIPDDETPLAPGPDNDADTPSDNEGSDSSNDDNDGITEIEDEDTPLSDGTDIEDEDVPLSDGSDLDDAETIIEDEDTPLSDNPLTGDSVSVLWAVLAVMAAMGLLVVFVAGKRKKED